ncbi:hypothetical protein CANARDRAFT_9269 [[Candida] arabinofermentans NRRL YB-2248]|uniref:DNA damage-binding protein CMR1 n=1 Tax=[Candida] arabinofermentans NRRL YB-2248 TaxID=983967 RepID=A0A1E4SW28_9ASCO|nr:hypothetical protein CANARDRAFT_9269 [[Candida] arabinofermentans NRRL YB-2248]
MALSEFEKQRQLNISRNKELFKKLNISNVSNDFHSEVRPAKRAKNTSSNSSRSQKKVQVKQEPTAPTRRSRRLAGVKLEDSDAESKLEYEEKKKENDRIEQLKRIRLSGDLSLGDLISTSVKKEEDESVVLEKLSKLKSNISLGDFYEDTKDRTATKEISELRTELESLELYEKFEPNEIRLTTERMTSILFHPSNTRKIVIGGDKVGEMGIWSVDDESIEEPEISHFRNHRAHIPKLAIREEQPTEIVSCSYDGSIRLLDIEQSVSRSILDFDDEFGNPCSISDFNFVDVNTCYFTTLSGEFGIFDTRSKKVTNKRSDIKTILRCHDKKIGSFAVNPSNSNQFVTASLDRSMRVWDLRSSKSAVWSDYEDSNSPHCIGSYPNRLSISTADWNRSGDIVCNGYADAIHIFQLGSTVSNCKKDFTISATADMDQEIEGIPSNLIPTNSLAHNCQTGRWVSILKARWQAKPKDNVEKFIIGNMKRYFDIFDRNGTQLAHLSSDRITSVPAVCCLHPVENWVVGGNASGKAMLFT